MMDPDRLAALAAAIRTCEAEANALGLELTAYLLALAGADVEEAAS